MMLFYQSKNNIKPKLLLSYHENGLRLKMILSVPQGSQKETFFNQNCLRLKQFVSE